MEYRPGKEGGKPDALTRREGDLPPADDKRLTCNVGILLPKERDRDIPDTEEIKIDVLETTIFQDINEGEIQKASRDDNENPRYQKEAGRRKERKEENSIGARSMEGRGLMVPRKNLDTKRRRDTNHTYREKPRPLTSRTRQDNKNDRTHQSTILLAKDKRTDRTIHQKLRHMSEDQSGPTCTLRTATANRSPQSTLEINSHGLH